MDMMNHLMLYEEGQLDDIATLILFSLLIKDGSAWTLQGHYGRTAYALIADGFLDEHGDFTSKATDFIKLNS